MPAKLPCHAGLPEPGEHLPPEPRAQALPCRTACSLIYEGQAGTGPSGRQGRQALRKVWGCPDPVAARREPAREAGRQPLQGQTRVSALMGWQECAPCLPSRILGTPDGPKNEESVGELSGPILSCSSGSRFPRDLWSLSEPRCLPHLRDVVASFFSRRGAFAKPCALGWESFLQVCVAP